MGENNISPSANIDWEKFRKAEERHKIGATLSLIRRAMIKAFSAIWGPVRGPRAARRLVYELSWRLAGARTYTSAGLPGRLFFEVR
jgi:spore maturation protein CgeB